MCRRSPIQRADILTDLFTTESLHPFTSPPVDLITWYSLHPADVAGWHGQHGQHGQCC